MTTFDDLTTPDEEARQLLGLLDKIEGHARINPKVERRGRPRLYSDNAAKMRAYRAVTPVIGRTFPVEEVADAHRLMESSTHIGKILLTF